MSSENNCSSVEATGTSSEFHTSSSNIRRCLPAIIVGLLGIFLRVVALGVVPGGYQMDEAYSAWTAFSLFHSGIDSAGYSYPVYFEAWGHGMNALNSYLMLPLIALNRGHVNLLIARIPQVLVSIASLGAIYALSLKISNVIGNWTLFLAAICPWHVMMSRWGLESDLAPGFLILGLCFFVYGLENHKLLVVSALCYGLSLYCYATIWTMLPFVLLLQTGYCIWQKKLTLDKWCVISTVLLGLMALPLICFLLVNMDYMDSFSIGPFSVYKMTMFRDHELAHSFSDVISNLKNLLYLFYHQDVGRPYDVIMPYGFFYDIGRFFIFFGILFVLLDCCNAFVYKRFSWSVLILIQLIGAAIVALTIPVNMTQINCVYLPLILCEATGVIRICGIIAGLFKKTSYRNTVSAVLQIGILCVYLICLAGFLYRYYTDYRELSSAYFQQGTDDAVRFALKAAEQKKLNVKINDALKYPNVLLSTETTGREYLDTVEYSENLPAPASFSKNDVRFYMGYDTDEIDSEHIYILYYTETEYFDDFQLTEFYDWYVAVPN